MPALLTPAPQVLLSERGGPVPSPDILTRMARVSPHLGLRWHADFDQSQWRVTWEWPESDLRWSRVRSGEIPRESAYDIVGYLPVDCTADEAPAYIERHLKHYPIEAVARTRENLSRWNETTIPEQQTTALVTDTLDDVGRAARAPRGQIILAPSSGRVGKPKGRR